MRQSHPVEWFLSSPITLLVSKFTKAAAVMLYACTMYLLVKSDFYPTLAN